MLKKLVAIAFTACLVAGCGGSDDTSGTPASGEGGSGGAAPTVIKWTAIPDHDPDALRAKYEPVSKYLSEKIGITFEYEPVSKYSASVDAFKNGDVMMAWFGGLTGVQARAEVPGSRAIVQGVEDPKYKSYFIAHASTGIEKSDAFPAAIADQPFAFGSESSTSGRLMPEHFIRQNAGKGPKEFFKQSFVFSGAHDKTAEWVQEGNKVKAGAIAYTTYDKMVKEGKIDPEVCRIVWVTPDYADYNFTAHPDLDKLHGAGTIDKIQKALVEMDAALCQAFDREDLVSAKNEDFQAIVDVAKTLGMVR